MAHDLVVKGGRVIDPASGHDGIADVALDGSRIAAVGQGLDGAEVHDATGLIVTPGLIDLHTHVYWGGTSLGIDPDDYGRRCSATTLVDTGSAGPGNVPGFIAHVVEPAETRVLVFLHISFAGIFAFSRTIMVGESNDMRLIAPRETLATARATPGTIAGIKVRVGRIASGPSGIGPLDVALEVADAAGLPLMAHIDEPPPTYAEVVARLRPGDILTHCYRPFPNAPVDATGKVHPAVREARARGVLFDIGHGMGSFGWDTAQAMMAAGFPPDTISSDVHALCLDGPARDLLYTMTKFMALGMDLPAIVRATTLAPADALRRPDLGRLTPGATGDVSLFRIEEGPVDLEDVTGKTLPYDRRLRPAGRVLGGRWSAP